MIYIKVAEMNNAFRISEGVEISFRETDLKY